MKHAFQLALRWTAALAVAAITVFGVAVSVDTQPADAWTGSYISSNSGGAILRTCPSTGCTARAWLPNGRNVDMICWTDAQWANGNYWSNRWFKVTAEGGSYYNYTGYVHSSLVASQTSVPRC